MTSNLREEIANRVEKYIVPDLQKAIAAQNQQIKSLEAANNERASEISSINIALDETNSNIEILQDNLVIVRDSIQTKIDKTIATLAVEQYIDPVELQNAISNITFPDMQAMIERQTQQIGGLESVTQEQGSAISGIQNSMTDMQSGLQKYVTDIATQVSTDTERVLTAGEIAGMLNDIMLDGKPLGSTIINLSNYITNSANHDYGVRNFALGGAGSVAKFEFAHDNVHDADNIFRINVRGSDGQWRWNAFNFDTNVLSFAAGGRIYAAGRDILAEIDEVKTKAGNVSDYLINSANHDYGVRNFALGGAGSVAKFEFAHDNVHDADNIFRINVRGSDGQWRWNAFNFDTNVLSFAAGGRIYAAGRDILAEIDALATTGLDFSSFQTQINDWIAIALAGHSVPTVGVEERTHATYGTGKWFVATYKTDSISLPINIPAIRSYFSTYLDMVAQKFDGVKAVLISLRDRFSAIGDTLGWLKNDYEELKRVLGKIDTAADNHPLVISFLDRVKFSLKTIENSVGGGTGTWIIPYSGAVNDIPWAFNGISAVVDEVRAQMKGAMTDIASLLPNLELPTF